MAPRKKATKKTAAAPKRIVGSMAERIDNLAVGESVAESTRFALEEADAADMLEAAKKMRNGLAANVARILDELDTREFVVESGAFVVESKVAIIVNATVTRIG